MVELLAVLAVSATLLAMASPAATAGRDALRVAGAARHLTSVIREYRSLSVKSGAHVALRFSDLDEPASWAAFLDGNGNGVRTADVASGIDPSVAPACRVGDTFGGVTFGIVPGTRDIDDGQVLVGPPVRFGAGNWLSFSPAGSATSGTVYLRGRGTSQFAIRVFGATGRTRLLRFDPSAGRWVAP